MNNLFLWMFQGYGYAKVSKTQREKFGKMIEEYITKRERICN